MQVRIGIGGPFGNGKTYLADRLATKLSSAQILPFAKRLKDLCKIQEQPFYDWRDQLHIELYYDIPNKADRESLVEQVINAFLIHTYIPGMKNRKLLQYVGTEIFRKYDPDFWIKAIRREIDPTKKFIIHDDLRFANEARDMTLIVEITGGAYSLTHESEMGLWKQYIDANFIIPRGFTDDQVHHLAREITYACGD